MAVAFAGELDEILAGGLVEHLHCSVRLQMPRV
jgi:hypothetical protein